MSINWYPGHMVTARTKAAETMRTTDLVIEVLDARAPQSSCNPVFERLRKAGQRPALKLLNKSDMADPEQTRRWLQHYNAQAGVQAIGLCAKKQGELERVLTACRALRPDRGAPDKPLRMMILGIPNAGKSTLMNAILKRHVAHVGDEPAITKIQMFHRLGPGMSLVDTPGMLWPGMEQATAYRLAALHSIGRGAYDDEEVALTLGLYLLRHYPELVAQRYGVLPRPCDEHMLLALIATGRSLAKKAGGGPDVARASVALLNDFRTGTLGRITLETVDEGPQ
ncbi:MAG TPA: ribosome biogenesis GTPase YlqF [Polyangia bacterium]|nr:ribosome biogenesis GTPase YlqF [Polyangia bacterium]